MRQFDFYEFAGYLVPGVLFLAGICYVWPSVDKALPTGDISFGDFGLGIILAYAVGQLLQAIGNGIENCWWWLWGGMPTDWLRTGKHELIATGQAVHVEPKIGQLLANPSFKLAGVNRSEWYSITRQAYAAVAAAKRNERLDIFNGNYGLCRGIAAALVVLVSWSVVANWSAWKVHVAFATFLVLAVYRMHRFGVRYGRELFVQFLQLPGGEQASINTNSGQGIS